MSICMPLSDESFRPVTSVLVRTTPSAVEASQADAHENDRISDLEKRLGRLENGHLTALDLIRRALTTLRNTQTEQTVAQSQAITRLAAQLTECEAALARLDDARKHDDEAMRERLFDMSEALESVRATASAAVRPAALRKLENALGRDIEACAETLRAEFNEQIAGAVEAAESRSARALDALEENVFDDITEIARRFDCLADTVVKVRLEIGGNGAVGTAGGDDLADPHSDDGLIHAAKSREETPSAIIPFPPRSVTVQGADEKKPGGTQSDVGAVLSAAARRAGQPGEPAGDSEEVERDLSPLGRIVSSAGSAVMAVCIMGGLSLLAGPALGPTFQGAPPAFAHDSSGWAPVSAEPLPVTVKLHLTPILRTDGEAAAAKSAVNVPSGR